MLSSKVNYKIVSLGKGLIFANILALTLFIGVFGQEVNAATNGSHGSNSVVTCVGVPPASPQIFVNWLDVSGALDYTAVRGVTTVYAGAIPSFTDTTVSYGSSYTYLITATDGSINILDTWNHNSDVATCDASVNVTVIGNTGLVQWTVGSGADSVTGSGSNSSTLRPSSVGDSYTLTITTPATCAIPNITNTDGGGANLVLSPGVSKGFTVTCTAPPPASADLKARQTGVGSYVDTLSVPFGSSVELQWDDAAGICSVYKATPPSWPVSVFMTAPQGSIRNAQSTQIYENAPFHVDCGSGIVDTVQVNVTDGGVIVEVSGDNVNYTDNLNFTPSTTQLFWVRYLSTNIGIGGCSGTIGGTAINSGYGSSGASPYWSPYYPTYPLQPAFFATAPTPVLYSISCIGGNGVTYADSATVNIVWPAPPAPTIALGAAGTCSSQGVSLSWNATTGATTFKLYRNGSLLMTTGGTSHYDNTVTPGQNYSYYVIANSPTGGDSAPSNTVNVTAYNGGPCVVAPPTPTGLNATPGLCNTGQIVLDWNSSVGATDYILRYAGTNIIVYNGPLLTYTDSLLIPGNTYSYTIEAYNSGNSAGSSPRSASVSADAPNICSANLPPNVAAGSDKSIILPVTSSSLTGTATDPDGTISSTEWTERSRPVGAPASVIANKNALTTNITGLTTVGTYTFRLTATDNLGLTGYDEVNISVTAVAASDLTASSPSPVTPVVSGIARAYSSTISNIGSGSTGGSFLNLFQFDDDTNHLIVIATQTISGGPIAQSASAIVTSAPYAFPTSGPWYVRTCADNDASFVGTITESNDLNNCSNWEQITVTAAVGPFDFSLSNGGSVLVTKGSGPVSQSGTVTATLTSGATQPVTFSITSPSPMPSGVSVSLANNPCSPNLSCTTTLNFTVQSSASVATHPITVQATGGSVTKSTNFNLVISPPAGLSVSINVPPTAVVGQPVTWDANVSGGTSCTYSWTGTDFPGSPTTEDYTFTYQTTGLKTATIVVICNEGTVNANGTIQINVDPEYKEF
jgi:fibronectin type 3 domain-containing protein